MRKQTSPNVKVNALERTLEHSQKNGTSYSSSEGSLGTR
jgi:hypothetical protein